MFTDTPIFDEMTAAITPELPYLAELYGAHGAVIRAFGSPPLPPLAIPAEPVLITDLLGAEPVQVKTWREQLTSRLNGPKPNAPARLVLPGGGR